MGFLNDFVIGHNDSFDVEGSTPRQSDGRLPTIQGEDSMIIESYLAELMSGAILLDSTDQDMFEVADAIMQRVVDGEGHPLSWTVFQDNQNENAQVNGSLNCFQVTGAQILNRKAGE